MHSKMYDYPVKHGSTTGNNGSKYISFKIPKETKLSEERTKENKQQLVKRKDESYSQGPIDNGV